MSTCTEIDREHWSGEGDFTEKLLAWLSDQSAIVFVRVEDASSTRADVEYNFISNEIYVRFRTDERQEHRRFLGIIPVRRMVREKAMTLEQLDAALTADPDLAAPDYADEGMIQYLHTQQVIPPYQTRGYKLVELVRIYEVGTLLRNE